MLLFSMLLKAQWSNNPQENLQVTNLSGEQVIPKIAVCPNGNYFIGYFKLENQNYSVYLHLLDSQGNKLWPDNGILISNHPSMTWLTDWDMAADYDNHAILSWQDIRIDGNNNTVAYRISPEGNFDWGDNGIMLSSSTAFDVAPKVTITTDNNAVFAWQSDDVIIIQKINAEGIKQWGEWGITLTSTYRYSWPQLMPVGESDFLMKYFEDSGPTWSPTRHIHAQRFDTDGLPVWETSTVVSNAGSISAWSQIFPFVNDGNDGFYITWHDYRLSGTIASAWTQHVNNQGEAQFPANGSLLSTQSATNQFYPQLAKLAGDENLYVYWNEVNGDQNLWGISGQKISPDGTRLWSDTGVEIFPLSTKALLPQAALPAGSNVMVIYEDFFNGTETALRAMLLDEEGEFVLENESVPISSIQSNKVHLEISSFFSNQWILTWEDDRNGPVNVYAQNIHPDGSLGLPAVSGSISGTVIIEGNMADVTEVVISAGDSITSPNSEGLYSIMLLPGTYSVTATHPYAETQTIENVEVEPEAITEDIDFDLMMLRRNMLCHAVDQFEAYVDGIHIEVLGPEETYSGISLTEPLVFSNVPYGSYFGTATINAETPIIVESDTIIDTENGDIYFRFIIGQVLSNSENISLRVFPNPISIASKIIINSYKPGSYWLSIYTSDGKKISSNHKIRVVSGENNIELKSIIPIGNLSSGKYILQLSNGQMSRAINFVVNF